MLEKYYLQRENNTDLSVYRCGIEECSPGHSWGPGLRDHFIIHYVLKGKGYFTINNTQYEVSENHGFLISPNQIVSYNADNNDPWTYSWVGFMGLRADGLLQKAGITLTNPVFYCSDNENIKVSLDNMLAAARLDSVSETMLLGYLYLFLSHLIKSNRENNPDINKISNTEKYIRKAIEYISRNYSGKLTISDIAAKIGIDRSYLFSLFYKHLNTSPKTFLIEYRINKAIELMKNPSLSIGEISRSVGYDDPLLFSRIFKRYKNIAPLEYRNKM